MTMKLWTLTGFPAGAIMRGSNAMSIAAASVEDAIFLATDALRRRGFSGTLNLNAKAE